MKFFHFYAGLCCFLFIAYSQVLMSQHTTDETCNYKRCIMLCLHNTGWLLRRQKLKSYRKGLVFTPKKGAFCNGMKLRRADLESEASYIG